MVSPLHTWKHTEPKGLWPAVSGLAVMAHIGVIGLSLPYVGGLFSSNSDSAAVVPIELIVESEAKEPTEASFQPTTGEVSETIPPKSNPDTHKTLPSANPATTVASSINETPAEAPSKQSAKPGEPSSEPAQDIQNNTDSPVEPEASGEDATSSKDTEGINSSTENEASPSVTQEEEASPIEEENASNPNEEEELPIVGGGQLPDPDDTSFNQGADQVTALSLSSHTLVADEFRKDRFAITPPVPTEVSTAPVRPQDVGCQEVAELPAMPLTYRVTISTGGIIQAATPWTGNNAAPSLSESERSIICLLERSGWRFTPATDEDDIPIPHSDLLLTFTLDLSTD